MSLLRFGAHIFKYRTHRKRVMAASCSSVTSGKKHVNGVDLYYEQTGRGKHVVLLIPGSLMNCQLDFAYQMKSLNKERFTIVGYDPRGYGKSRPPRRDFPLDYYERDAKDAVDLMKALGFDKFSLLGSSAGGTSAMIAAAKNPDVIKKMVVWGANCYVNLQGLKAFRECEFDGDIVAQLAEDMGNREEFFKTLDACVETLTQLGNRPEGNICKDLLPHISCPTLIIHGEKDLFMSTPDAQYLLKHIKGSRLHLVPDGLHQIHQQKPDEFNKLVEDFLDE